MEYKYDFIIFGGYRNKENVLKICDLFDKYNISYYCFFKSEEFINNSIIIDQIEKQKKYTTEGFAIKSSIPLKILNNNLKMEKKARKILLVIPSGNTGYLETKIAFSKGKACYSVGRNNLKDTYKYFNQMFKNEKEIEEFLINYKEEYIGRCIRKI